jgi:hypothetical protein
MRDRWLERKGSGWQQRYRSTPQQDSAAIKGEIHLVLFHHRAIIIQAEKWGNARFKDNAN